jgi:hypothetical protein
MLVVLMKIINQFADLVQREPFGVEGPRATQVHCFGQLMIRKEKEKKERIE